MGLEKMSKFSIVSSSQDSAKPKNDLCEPSKCGSTQNMTSNIKVAVRVRPLTEREQGLSVVVDVVDESMLVFDPKEKQRPFFYQGIQRPNKNYHKRANKEQKFVYDNVCNQDATNQDVFEITTKDMLESLMDGYNCSVFAYGATGAGKTFTMIGSKEHPGITYLTMEHLFSIINSFESEREFDIAVSYIEVYNENVYDLLRPSKTPLQLREDSKYGVMVAGMTMNNIKTAKELFSMLENGNRNRTQHPTDANAESSRSHAVFQVYIKMRYKTSNQSRIVKLSMIDLAGSERASATGCVGQRFKEGANINKSLLSLGNCINRLAEKSNYIPYRDSKLTRLLKDSLGGNCKTIMIANISPSSISYEDTYNTLKYASRASEIQLTVKKNVVDGDMRISQYVKVIEELKRKNKELEAKLSLSSLSAVAEPKQDLAKEKLLQEWRRRLKFESASHAALESELLGLMCQQRVLALRHRLQTRGLSHIIDLHHRSSFEALEQMNNEDIPRQERATENYHKKATQLDSKVHVIWTKWEGSYKKLKSLCDQALVEYPELDSFVENMKMQSEIRQLKAKENLGLKISTLQNAELTALTKYTIEMPNMMKKLYLTLKGYDKVPPALADEYLKIMKQAKSAKGITWSDDNNESVDAHFKFISTLNVHKPTMTPLTPDSNMTKYDPNVTVDIVTDSEDFIDLENQEPINLSAKKRKGTPIKLANNETIIINESFDLMDTARSNSAKKVKTEFDSDLDIENYGSGAIDPKNLNSTFVLAGKMDMLKKSVKFEDKTDVIQPAKTGLSDATNSMQRNFNFSESKARIVKPVVGRAIPFRRSTVGNQVARPAPGFGSSLARDGTPLQRNTNAVRSRERMQTHPYSRPTTTRR